MTDIVATPLSPRGKPGIHTDAAAKGRLKARYGAELRFKWLGASAVGLAAVFLLLLLSTIVTQGLPAFRMNYLTLPVNLSAVPADPAARAAFDYAGPVNEAVGAKFPDVTGRQERRLLRGIVSTGSGVILRQKVENDASLAGKTVDVQVPLDDFADLYFKGLLAESAAPQQLPGVTVSGAATLT
jgi:phosphate transport system permease protein